MENSEATLRQAAKVAEYNHAVALLDNGVAVKCDADINVCEPARNTRQHNSSP